MNVVTLIDRLSNDLTGPYCINGTSDKYFTVDIDCNSTNVSIDRLKSAYVS